MATCLGSSYTVLPVCSRDQNAVLYRGCRTQTHMPGYKELYDFLEAFKLMLGNILRTTRVHSSQALEGLLFTTFVALCILTNLRVRMKADLNGQPISSNFTIAEVIARLKKIQLIELEGKKYLINVSAKDKKLVEALGFAGLYDSPDAVLNALDKIQMRNIGAVIPQLDRDFALHLPGNGTDAYPLN